jgi:hypothetical protein
VGYIYLTQKTILKYKTLFLFCLIILAFSNVVNSQMAAFNVNLQSPNYYGGRGKKLNDAMIGLSYEYLLGSKDKFTLDAGFGFLWKMTPNTYNGTVQCLKYDYSTNQNMPSSIPVNYYYKQAHLGMQLSLDLRFYPMEIDNAGLYFSLGAGFDMLTFDSHLNKFDDFDYYPDYANYPETPDGVLDNYTDSTSIMRTSALNLRSCIGYNFQIGRSWFFVECYLNYTPASGKDKSPVDEIYTRRIMIGPSIGFKLK